MCARACVRARARVSGTIRRGRPCSQTLLGGKRDSAKSCCSCAIPARKPRWSPTSGGTLRASVMRCRASRLRHRSSAQRTFSSTPTKGPRWSGWGALPPKTINGAERGIASQHTQLPSFKASRPEPEPAVGSPTSSSSSVRAAGAQHSPLSLPSSHRDINHRDRGHQHGPANTEIAQEAAERNAMFCKKKTPCGIDCWATGRARSECTVCLEAESICTTHELS